ncbi:ABC transporter permease [Myxococcota bacterium]|nr:ABC transporter permease [Myxococcota bacterium]
MNALATLLHSLKSAVSSLWAYRLRSVLTALGVMVGVATVIAILAVIEGLNASFREQVASLGTGTLYVTRRPWIQLGDWWKYSRRPDVTHRDAESLDGRMHRAKAVVPFVDERVSVEIGRSTLRAVRLIGSTAEWPMMSGLEPTDGRFFARGDVEAAREVVAVGADVARTLKDEGLAIGDTITIAGRRLKVIGTMPERGRIFGQSQDDFVVMPMTLFERVMGTRRSLSIGVVVDPDELDLAADEITAAMRIHRGLEPWEDDNFSVNQQEMFVELYRELTRSLFATAIGLGIVTLIVGGVGIMNIMLVAVAERTKEIGIRKALGARPNTILLQFVVEASMVSGFGGAMGTLLGVLMAKGVAEWTPLAARVAPYSLVVGVVFGIFVGLTFGFLPALRASRLVPVRALSSEQ